MGLMQVQLMRCEDKPWQARQLWQAVVVVLLRQLLSVDGDEEPRKDSSGVGQAAHIM